MNIQDLPSDIHYHLLTFLDWPTLVALRLSATSFARLLSADGLKSQYVLCAAYLYEQEKKARSMLDAAFWEAAEQAFFGIGYHNYSSSHDPDLDAIQKRRSCSSDSLPCYFCLRWLPSSTSQDRFASFSHFSRTRSTLDFDVGGQRARERNCVSCGLKCGIYQRGTVVKHSVVCINCGKLCDPIPGWTHVWSFNSRGSARSYFCQACYDDTNVLKLEDEQYWHERQYGKYDAGLRKGKAYRLEKGRRLREDKGIEALVDNKDRSVDVQQGKLWSKRTTGRDRHGRPPCSDRGPNAGYCPIMREMRFCPCGGWTPPWSRIVR